MGQRFQKVFSLVCALIVSFNLLVVPAFASFTDRPHSQVLDDYGTLDWFSSWIVGTKAFGYMSYSDNNYTANKPPKYYTTPTSSVQDKNGNVTNYYRGGDTTTTNIIDSYNKTFNTFWNTNNTTNNYQANVKLNNFLNQYTTNNVTTNNTSSANFKSWYYDNTTNNYNYNEFNKYNTTNNYLYYNQDNSKSLSRN